MLYILIPLSLAVVAALVWAWWQDRVGRDPVNSIDSFHRALTAMEPGRSADTNGGERGRLIDLDAPEVDEREADEDASHEQAARP